MMASGLPPFQLAGTMGLEGKMFCRSIFALKNPVFKNIVDAWNKSASGRYNKSVGEAFERFFARLMPDAVKGVRVSTLTKHTVDFDWQGYWIEIKTGTSSFNFEQLDAIIAGAHLKGRTVVYYFIERPTANIEKAVLSKGASLVYFFESRKK
jgi:hypothetical protein